MNYNLIEKINELTGLNGDRRRDYDHPLLNHLRISLIWSVQKGIVFNPIEVAWMLGAGLKLARQAKTSKFDNVIDNAGYMNCITEMCNLFYEMQYSMYEEKDKPLLDENMMTTLMRDLESYTFGQQWELLQHCIKYLDDKEKLNETVEEYFKTII